MLFEVCRNYLSVIAVCGNGDCDSRIVGSHSPRYISKSCSNTKLIKVAQPLISVGFAVTALRPHFHFGLATPAAGCVSLLCSRPAHGWRAPARAAAVLSRVANGGFSEERLPSWTAVVVTPLLNRPCAASFHPQRFIPPRKRRRAPLAAALQDASRSSTLTVSVPSFGLRKCSRVTAAAFVSRISFCSSERQFAPSPRS